MRTATVCFLVTTGSQLENVRRVVAAADLDAVALDVYHGELLDDLREPVRAVRPGYTAAARAAASVRRWVRAGGRVIVAGQDVGLVERAALAAGRRAGAKLVLLPDGLVFETPQVAATVGGRAKAALDRALARAGLLVGRRGLFGSSDPDLLLSWGAGWDETWRRTAPSADIVDAGSPRADALAAVPPPTEQGRVLICSQNLFSLGGEAGRASEAWYRWIDEVAAGASPGTVRVRLHPAERASLDRVALGAAALDTVTTGDLLDDLTWADTVMAPASTVLLEALACGRVVAPVDVGLGGLLQSCALFREPAMAPVLAGVSHRELSAIIETRREAQRPLRDRYLANVGTASATCARLIDGLAGGHDHD